MQELENAYNKIKKVYDVASIKYKKRPVDVCLQWIVENMYRINYAYKYILKSEKNENNEKIKILEEEIKKLAQVADILENRIDYKYRKTENMTKLEEKIKASIVRIEYAENLEDINLDKKIEIKKTKIKNKPEITKLKNIKIELEKEKEIYEIGKGYFKYILDTVNEDSNYLGVDYIDFSRNKKNRFKYITSPTNIGFCIVSIISGIDLNYIDKNSGEVILNKMINTLLSLEKQDGLFYNWYDSKTKKVENKFISSVDNGNLLASLYVLKTYFNMENTKVNELIEKMQMNKFVDREKNSLCIGIDECGKQTTNIYDRLMSESRLTIFTMIAREELTEKVWYKLKREKMENGKALYSWTGCSFEYYLPNLFMPTYKDSEIYYSNLECYLKNVEYMNDFSLPAFGLNASSYPKKTSKNVYHYKEFGIEKLRLRVDRYEDFVVSPSASILMLKYAPKEVVENLEALNNLNMQNVYGLMDSVDLDKRTRDEKGRYKVAKIYNTHNVSMSIISINNYLNNDVIVNRFIRNEKIQKKLDILK